MSLQQFYDTLSVVIADKKSGKLYVNTKHHGLRKIAIFLISSGDVIDVHYDHQVGKAALEEILSLEVEKVIFIPTSTGEEEKKDSDLPTTLSILSRLRDRLTYIRLGFDK